MPTNVLRGWSLPLVDWVVSFRHPHVMHVTSVAAPHRLLRASNANIAYTDRCISTTSNNNNTARRMSKFPHATPIIRPSCHILFSV
jgi:hypothetical protein